MKKVYCDLCTNEINFSNSINNEYFKMIVTEVYPTGKDTKERTGKEEFEQSHINYDLCKDCKNFIKFIFDKSDKIMYRGTAITLIDALKKYREDFREI